MINNSQFYISMYLSYELNTCYLSINEGEGLLLL